jgi:hypothetical protein
MGCVEKGVQVLIVIVKHRIGWKYRALSGYICHEQKNIGFPI